MSGTSTSQDTAYKLTAIYYLIRPIYALSSYEY